jgi:SAM-dependent methyltransferase
VNALVEPGQREPEKRYPLDVVRCPRCTLVQISKTVPPETLFRTYPYFSSYSDTFLDHARRFANRSVATLELGQRSLVVEAASNDGYLLQFFQQQGVRVLGIEPAINIAEAARARGIETISEFLDAELACSIVAEHGVADLVVANNVLAHVPDLHGFVSALSTLAGNTGLVVIEVPNLRDLIDRLEFDTMYHEHLCYFTLTSLKPIFEAHDLTVRGVERLPVHGGSLRLFVSSQGGSDSTVEELLAEEQAWGVDDPDRFVRFREAVELLRSEVHQVVARLVSSGATVAAYGAAAKGVLLANACNLDAQLVRFVVDRNPRKQGKLLPGVRIPIEGPAALLERQPDYCLLFAWNVADEIIEQQATYLERGGRFVAPIPTPHVINA